MEIFIIVNLMELANMFIKMKIIHMMDIGKFKFYKV